MVIPLFESCNNIGHRNVKLVYLSLNVLTLYVSDPLNYFPWTSVDYHEHDRVVHVFTFYLNGSTLIYRMTVLGYISLHEFLMCGEIHIGRL